MLGLKVEDEIRCVDHIGPHQPALKHPAFVQEEAFVRFGLLQGRAQSVAQEECIANLGIDPNVRSRAGRLGNGDVTILDSCLILYPLRGRSSSRISRNSRGDWSIRSTVAGDRSGTISNQSLRQPAGCCW